MSAEAVARRILVIDDAWELLLVVKRRLLRWGYEVLTTTSGEDGIHMAETELPDLILLDIMMPKMKGREVCAKLKTNPQTRPIPIIFVTALGLPDHIKAGLDLGADDYIVKPFESVELKDRIAVCLARHGKRSQPQ